MTLDDSTIDAIADRVVQRLLGHTKTSSVKELVSSPEFGRMLNLKGRNRGEQLEKYVFENLKVKA